MIRSRELLCFVTVGFLRLLGGGIVAISAAQSDQFVFERTLVTAFPFAVLGLNFSVLCIRCPRKKTG
jgi:hypothetical protein